jgi:hypothetical protein
LLDALLLDQLIATGGAGLQQWSLIANRDNILNRAQRKGQVYFGLVADVQYDIRLLRGFESLCISADHVVARDQERDSVGAVRSCSRAGDYPGVCIFCRDLCSSDTRSIGILNATSHSCASFLCA